MTTNGDEAPIPTRRLQPKDHLRRAAQAAIDSEAEHYHLSAAQAEALEGIEHWLCSIDTTMTAMEQHLLLLTKIAQSVAERWLEQTR